MGDNSAFTAFENVVVSVYSRGALDKALLKDLAEPYRGSDIDSGGMDGHLSKRVVGPDGVARRLDVVDIVIQTWTGKVPPFAPKRPKEKDYSKWTDAQRDENEKYQDDKWTLFHKITGDVFGW
jgi:hypothetical protein